MAMRFLPNGSTDLVPTANWYLTVHSGLSGDPMASPPPNFVTIQVDPVSGIVVFYRP